MRIHFIETETNDTETFTPNKKILKPRKENPIKNARKEKERQRKLEREQKRKTKELFV